MYIQGQPKFPEYVSCNLDFSTINYNIPQTIRFTVRMYGTNFPCVLEIVDTTPPTAEAVPHSMYSVDAIPPVEECVINIYDLNETTVEWLEVPDISAGGNIIAKAVVTDSSGNQTIVEVPFTVTKDSEAPVIEGTKNLEAFVGDAIRYREEVTVTDDIDPNPVLEIDTSNVDLKTAGTYDVIYRAKDFSGNVSEVTIKLKLTKKPKTYVEPEKVYAEANKVLKKIIKPNMTDMEKALQITYWVRYNIYYISNCDDTSWTRAAYDGFTKREGNCYTYASCARALFDVAGIENMVIVRHPYIHNPHFWNYIKIDGEWYHCDATEGYNDHPGVWFMCTDAQINDKYHHFNGALYPARAGGSKDFATPTPLPEEETPTPTPSPSTTEAPVDTITPTPSEEPSTPSATPTTAPVDTQPATPSPEPTPEDSPSPIPTPAETTPAPAEPDPAPDEDGQ